MTLTSIDRKHIFEIARKVYLDLQNVFTFYVGTAGFSMWGWLVHQTAKGKVLICQMMAQNLCGSNVCLVQHNIKKETNKKLRVFQTAWTHSMLHGSKHTSWQPCPLPKTNGIRGKPLVSEGGPSAAMVCDWPAKHENHEPPLGHVWLVNFNFRHPKWNHEPASQTKPTRLLARGTFW